MGLEYIKSLLISLVEGIYESDIAEDNRVLVDDLIHKKALKKDKNGKCKLNANHCVGKIDISANGTGYLENLVNEKRRDLIIEPKDLKGASRGDLVVAKRDPSNRQKAKVVSVIAKKFSHYVGVTSTIKGNVVVKNIKTAIIVEVKATQKSLKQLPPNTLLKIESSTGIISEVLGVLNDPLVDEKVSLSLYNKSEFFTKQSEEEAKSYGDEVYKSLYPNRVNLTNLPFCTIDPNDAKDFDDAIYFDEENFTIYIAIADVSEYVFPFGNIDKEARKRGFSIYFPHKSIPMLPRTLSENICSLKPDVDRLVFGFKIMVDKVSLEVKSEELFEGIINSKKRYTYDSVDKFIVDTSAKKDGVDRLILSSLMPLFKLTQRLREKRVQSSFIFQSSEIRMFIDEKQNITATKLEEETPSHALVEECMLLANRAAAKCISYGIFRVHEQPSFEKIDKLLNDLSLIGIEIEFYQDIPSLIKAIQAKADEIRVRTDVDKLIIKSQKQACYSAENGQHFGLGFDTYSHFTSPIRRYSDLILHRLLKSQIRNDMRLNRFQLENIEILCEKLSELERESDRVALDFEDRKFARWAANHQGECFKCKIVDSSKTPIAILDDEFKGARIFLTDSDFDLFEKVSVRILFVDIANAKITGEIVKRLD